MDFPYLFEHGEKHFNTLHNFVKWIFLLLVIRTKGSRYRLFMFMDFLCSSDEFVSNKHWTPHARHTSSCCIVLLLRGKAMIYRFQLVCEHVLCLTTYLCSCLDSTFLTRSIGRSAGLINQAVMFSGYVLSLPAQQQWPRQDQRACET